MAKDGCRCKVRDYQFQRPSCATCYLVGFETKTPPHGNTKMISHYICVGNMISEFTHYIKPDGSQLDAYVWGYGTKGRLGLGDDR